MAQKQPDFCHFLSTFKPARGLQRRGLRGSGGSGAPVRAADDRGGHRSPRIRSRGPGRLSRRPVSLDRAQGERHLLLRRLEQQVLCLRLVRFRDDQRGFRLDGRERRLSGHVSGAQRKPGESLRVLDEIPSEIDRQPFSASRFLPDHPEIFVGSLSKSIGSTSSRSRPGISRGESNAFTR